MVNVLEMLEKLEMSESDSVKVTHFNAITSGPILPHRLAEAAVIEHDESFVIIGGHARQVWTDKIYRYNATSGGWTKLQTTLSEGKRSVTAMKVKASAFDLCNTIG